MDYLLCTRYSLCVSYHWWLSYCLMFELELSRCKGIYNYSTNSVLNRYVFLLSYCCHMPCSKEVASTYTKGMIPNVAKIRVICTKMNIMKNIRSINLATIFHSSRIASSVSRLAIFSTVVLSKMPSLQLVPDLLWWSSSKSTHFKLVLLDPSFRRLGTSATRAVPDWHVRYRMVRFNHSGTGASGALW